jgi:hypothetical protein
MQCIICQIHLRFFAQAAHENGTTAPHDVYAEVHSEKGQGLFRMLLDKC